MKTIFDEVEDLFKFFDKDFDDAFYTPKYVVPSFPPCNVNIVDKSDVIFEFALAGYKKEDLKISYENNKLILSTTDEYKEKKDLDDRKENTKVFNNEIRLLKEKGIKKPAFSYSYFLPEKKININDLSAKFEDGILTIKIPLVKEEKKENKSTFVIS